MATRESSLISINSHLEQITINHIDRPPASFCISLLIFGLERKTIDIDGKDILKQVAGILVIGCLKSNV